MLEKNDERVENAGRIRTRTIAVTCVFMSGSRAGNDSSVASVSGNMVEVGTE